MPYVGNGHVATVVFSDFIYMNGLYNGVNGSFISCFGTVRSHSLSLGTSHRARIPSTLNWRFQMGSSLKSSSYSLDVSSGAFIERLENDQVRVERRIFASQEYNELLLAHVTITRLTARGLSIDEIFRIN